MHWTVILRKKILWKLTITGKLVGDAFENKKIVLKEQQKEKQFDGLLKISLKTNHCTESNCPNATQCELLYVCS